MRSWFWLVPLLLAGSALAQEPGKGEKPPEEPDPAAHGKLTLAIDPGRHTSAIQRAFFNPSDGNQLITLAGDGAIRLWDLADVRTINKKEGIIEVPTTKVIYPPGVPYMAKAAMSQDGKRLAVPARHLEQGKEVHALYVLSLPNGRIEKVVRHPPIRRYDAPAFSPDGKRVAFGAEGGIWLSDLTRDEPPKAILKGTVSLGGLAFSPDGKRLAAVRIFGNFKVGGQPKSGVILDVESGKVLAPIEGQAGVAWSPDGKSIAGLHGNGRAWLYDDQGQLRHSVIHNGFGVDVRFSPDSKTLLVVGHDGAKHHRATLFDVETAKEMRRLVGAASTLALGGAFSPDGQVIATVGGATAIHLWRTSDPKDRKLIAGSVWLGGGGGMAWSKDGKSVQYGTGTFDLTELGFGPTLGKKQRHEPVLEKDGLMEKDGLTLKRLNPKEIEVIKDGKSVRKVACEAATLVDNDRMLLRRGTGVWLENALKPWGGQWAWPPSPDHRYRLRGALEAQRLQIFSGAEQGPPLLTLYRKGQDWIIWTKEGYYAATPGGERLIVWKVDNGIDQMPSVYPAERFRKQLHRPDVIKKAFELGSVAAALKALDGKEAKPADLEQILPPQVTSVEIVDDKNLPKLTLRVKAKSGARGQPITALRVLVDGRPLPSQGAVQLKQPSHDYNDVISVTLPGTKQAGPFRLSVLARSSDASSTSHAVEVTYIDRAKLPTLHVLAIGIDKYKEKELKLECAVADAKAIVTTFQKAGKGDQYKEVRGRVLPDAEASKQTILKELALLQKSVDSQDLVVVFFAGHGVQNKHGFYLLPHEVDTSSDDTIKKTALSGVELREALGSKNFRGQVLLMLDACHSGAFGDKKKGKKGVFEGRFKPATDDLTRDFTDDEVGIAVLCAAMGHQKAQERDGHGLFTRAIVQALNKADGVSFNRHDGRLYISHLHTFVFDEVKAQSGEEQHPFYLLPSTVQPFPLVKFAKAAGGK